ncbi:hypothetical protein ACN2MM_06055 [Alkalilimnicola ehrlichii MLHE-1]|uniref:DUF1566 domain-containing protein n=1 Tax=Alkalilimnicola ehrlichii (strain ATCC BAA-1101 / DSM 17681 / MLHE-1) TaxID=187272 RepID=Q0A9Q5_ALKEH|nr:hypothetical protein [Alkalilimnicola ehrlichii]ABI56432.1 hypothetical protein Mlg_1080 [Alkalilimnicola ehrlichii MLHE-1]
MNSITQNFGAHGRLLTALAVALLGGGFASSAAACLEAGEETVGEVSDSFCGQEGWPLFYAGEVDGIKTFFDAESGDPQMRWDSATCHQCVGGVDTSFSDGYSNTYEVLWDYGDSDGLEGFDSARYCAEKGEGWFLPAIEQLELVWENRDRIDYSQVGWSDSAMPYWSSTVDKDTGQVLHVRFMDGQRAMFFTHFSRLVRCARAE